ncbi:hypothetical protein L9F63_013432, partial [Diploptera punctata]
ICMCGENDKKYTSIVILKLTSDNITHLMHFPGLLVVVRLECELDFDQCDAAIF